MSVDIDRRLTELREAVERVGANLVDLELAADLNPVGVALLEGASAKSWGATQGAQATLWSWYGLLSTLLDRAAELRRGRGHGRKETVAQLEQLLAGDSIELTAGDVPLASRGLLGASLSVERCSCDDLLRKMADAFAESTAVLARFALAWDVQAPRLRADAHRLDELAERARVLGGVCRAELESVRCRASQLEEALTKDPLSVDQTAIDEIEHAVERIEGTIEELAEFHRTADQRLAEAQRALDVLVEAVGRALAARAEAERKIARPAPPPLVTVGPRSALELDGIRALVEAGAWEQSRLELEQWTKRTTSLIERVRDATARTLATLESRDELRGRLRAYQAKALRLGVVEDVQLRLLFERALDALYVAPADLVEAEQFVVDYQRALVRRRAGHEVMS